MIVDSYAPPPPLSHFVSQFWHYENYVLAHNWERIMPSCKAALLINLDEDELRWRRMDGTVNRIRGFAICGPQPEPFEIDTRQQRFIMGVAFQGAGAASLLRIPGYEIAGAHLGLDDVFGHEATLLHERLIGAGSAAARFRILEEWLLPKAMAHDRPRVPIVHALSLVERMPVATVVDQLGTSPKRLIQAFRDEVGLPPKLYCRVRRFERLLNAIERSRDVNWALVGNHHGYYDQAHLAHEFRSLSGFSPSEYLALRGPYAQHVPLPG